MRRILLTTTSFQDTPGEHHKLLQDAGFEIVRDRGPLPEARMLELASKGDFDGWIIGDDAITRAARRKWPRRTSSPSSTARNRWPRQIRFEPWIFHC
jgi:hypothetical protein